MSEQRSLLCSEAERDSVFAHNGRRANCALPPPSAMAVPRCRAGVAGVAGRGRFQDAGKHLEQRRSQPGDVAWFIHDVAATLRMQGEQHFSQESETCGFRQQQEGLWLACNEHLSAMPERLPPP